MVEKKIVLIITNNLLLPGGVTNFFRIIKAKYDKKDIQIDFFSQGVNKKHDEIKKIEYLIQHIKDIFYFIKLLKNNKNIKIVQLNPSFILVPIFRDSFYVIISKIFKKKIITFFHGWDINFENKMIKNNILKKLFIEIYNKSDLFYVLSEDFKYSLEKIGITKKVNITKTTFNGDLYHSIEKKGDLFNFLYVGRLQKEKGIFTILRTLNEMKSEKRKFKVNFIGWFADKKTELEFSNMIESYKLSDYIEIKGYVSDKEKIQNLTKSDVFVFPTYYPEGCPTVVIEALAAGLFVITTDTAALKEIIKDNVHGILVKKNNHEDLKSSFEWCLSNKKKVIEIGKKNKDYAFNTLESEIIIEDFYKKYKELTSDKK